MGDDGNQIDLSPLAELDRLVHEPARLMVMACLLPVEKADYLYVLKQTRMTQGNLSSHLNKLESAGYVHVQKGFAGKMPRTTLALTPAGRRAFEKYRSQIVEALSKLPS